MKNILCLVFFFCLAKAFGQELAIIPQPVEIVQQTGSFVPNGNLTISYNQESARPIAEMLSEKVKIISEIQTTMQSGDGGNIQLNILPKSDPSIGKEGYFLEVNSETIVISANENAGLFYGLQTLKQLLPAEKNPQWSIPALKIKDYPRFSWRGMMLDVSRHFFNKEEVKKYIDEIASYKFNTFHWHLTDDNGWRIEIKSMPKLTEVGAWRVARNGYFGNRAEPQEGEPTTYGGYYTQEDVRDILEYAQERFVTVLPEIDVPGHSLAAIAAYPELSCTNNTAAKVNPGTAFSQWYGNGTFKMLIDNTLNPADEKVYDFLEKVFSEIAAIFPGTYIHVGGDECYKGYWKENQDCQALMKKLNIRHIEDLQGYFMGRVEKILKNLNKKMIGWDEIMEGGISQEAAVMCWRSVKPSIEATQSGHYVVMSPTDFAYLDYYQGEQTIEPQIYAGLRTKKSYSFEPVAEGVEEKYVLGGQGNLWTEQVPTLKHAEYMSFPRAWALSEVYWTPKTLKNWDTFSKKMEIHFLRAKSEQINCALSVYDPIVKTKLNNNKLIVEMESEVSDVDIFYTTDNTMPNTYSNKYEAPFEVPEGNTTLRTIMYRNGKPIGNLITLKRVDLEKRIGRNN